MMMMMMTMNESNISPLLDSSIQHIPLQTSTLLVFFNISFIPSFAPSHTSISTFDQSQPSKVSGGKMKTSTIDPAIRIVWLIFGPVIFVVGVCGNFFVLVIMNRKLMGGTSTCVHLSVMAAADLTVTLIGLTPEWLEICFDMAFKELHPATCKIEKFLFYTAADVSVWTLVIFTLDRYVAVCHPLRKKSVCTAKRARLFAATAILVAMAKNAHVFWTRGIQMKLGKHTNELVVVKLCGTTEARYEYFESYVRSWIVFVFVNCLPALIISICNFFIVKSMFAISKRSTSSSLINPELTSEVATVKLSREDESPRSSREYHFRAFKKSCVDEDDPKKSLRLPQHSISVPAGRYLQLPGRKFVSSRSLYQPPSTLPGRKSYSLSTLKSLAVSSTQTINNKALVQMTAMCLSASICFLVCNTPSVVLYVGREYWEKNEGYYVFKPLYNIFVYVNHAINFLLYCLTGQRFRRVFIDFFCCGGFRRERFAALRRYSDWGDNAQNASRYYATPGGRKASAMGGGRRLSHFLKRCPTPVEENFAKEIPEIV